MMFERVPLQRRLRQLVQILAMTWLLAPAPIHAQDAVTPSEEVAAPTPQVEAFESEPAAPRQDQASDVLDPDGVEAVADDHSGVEEIMVTAT
jgi:hypothetical protein